MNSTHHVRATAGNSDSTHSGAPEVQHLPPHWEPEPLRPRLPIGVAVFSVLLAITGLLLVIAGILVLLHLVANTIVPADLLILRRVDALGAAILVLLGSVILSVASALWRQEVWALYMMVVVLFLALAYLFFTASITLLFLLLLAAFIYLLAVRRHFF